MIASSSASVAACLRSQRRERVAAVAEDVEVEVRRLPPRAQSGEQRAQSVRLLERLAAADGHAVERVARRAAAPRDEVAHGDRLRRVLRPRVLRHAALAADRAALHPQADPPARPEHRHRPVRLVELQRCFLRPIQRPSPQPSPRWRGEGGPRPRRQCRCGVGIAHGIRPPSTLRSGERAGVRGTRGTHSSVTVMIRFSSSARSFTRERRAAGERKAEHRARQRIDEQRLELVADAAAAVAQVLRAQLAQPVLHARASTTRSTLCSSRTRFTTLRSMPSKICAPISGVMKPNTMMLSPMRFRISGRDSLYLK